MSTAFERYAPFIQEFIYQQGWQELRGIQEETASAILDSQDHVLICSDTASGKTEAAFFPILSQMKEKTDLQPGARVLYLSPLKALINDQFYRLSLLLQKAQIPLFPWHGDVSSNTKQRALRSAGSIVQMTPESLEAMLMKNEKSAIQLFSHLDFIVIDEIHAFLSSQRGLHLLCLLTRLERCTGAHPRRIALSATVADEQQAARFLKSTTPRNVKIAHAHTDNRRIQLLIRDFETPSAQMRLQPEGLRLLYTLCRQKRSLVFCNTRADCEQTALDLKKAAKEKKEADIYYVHHGSVSAAQRREVEERFKNSTQPVCAAATLTLELGIDIGDLDLTVQIGVPNTVESFVQRLGRSGRRTGISRMCFLTQRISAPYTAPESLPWQLLQAAAIIELYSRERWMEPAEIQAKPFSLLIHQTLSILYQYKELSARALASKVLTLPAFYGRITQEEYKKLLQHLLSIEILEQMENGSLILGTEAEKLVNHYTFYASFSDSVLYTVRYEGREIGTVEQNLQTGDHFILAGKSWIVAEVDEAAKTVQVLPGSGEKILSWSSGSGNIHEKIVQKMKEILLSDKPLPYLEQNTRQLLELAREKARVFSLDTTQVIYAPDGRILLFPWCSTACVKTIRALLSNGFRESLGIFSCQQKKFWLEVETFLDREDFIAALHDLPEKAEDSWLVLSDRPAPYTDKFDNLLSEEMRAVSYMKNELRLEQAMKVLHEIC